METTMADAALLNKGYSKVNRNDDKKSVLTFEKRISDHITVKIHLTFCSLIIVRNDDRFGEEFGGFYDIDDLDAIINKMKEMKEEEI